MVTTLEPRRLLNYYVFIDVTIQEYINYIQLDNLKIKGGGNSYKRSKDLYDKCSSVVISVEHLQIAMNIGAGLKLN